MSNQSKPTAPAEAKPSAQTPQVFGEYTVTTCRHTSTGQRFAKVAWRRAHPRFVPLDICGLAAGKDAWMRDILFKCEDCKTPVKVGTMQNGYCEDCTAKAEAENEAADSGATEAGAEFEGYMAQRTSDDAGEDYGNRMEAELAMRQATPHELAMTLIHSPRVAGAAAETLAFLR